MASFSRILVTDNSNKSSSVAAVSAAAPPPQPAALESNFIVILAALLCALISVLGLIAAARCAWCRRSGSRISNNRYPSQPSSANKGLKKKVLQSLPKFTYTTANTFQSQGLNSIGGSNSVKLAPLSSECAICLSEFVEGDELRVLPRCDHGFHLACIDKWLGSHSSCPSCRQILAVRRCQKCGQFPTVSSASAAAAAGGGSEVELSGDQNGAFTANNGAAFLP